MINLNLKEEDNFASISEGGPGSITGKLNKFPLETLLESVSNYSIKGLSEAKVQIDEGNIFQSPVILLYDKKKEKSAVCLIRRDLKGPTHYQIYNYSEPQDIFED